MSKIGTQTRRLGEFWQTMERAAEELGVDVDKVVDIATQNVELVKKWLSLAVELLNMIVRLAKVDRSRTSQQAIDATGRRQYVNKAVVGAMPRGSGETVEITYLKIGRYIRNMADLVTTLADLGYELLGDPLAVVADMEADPAFADEHPCADCWQDANGNWCYAAFLRYGGERGVYVDQDDFDWVGYWWFAVRKLSSK